MVFINAQVLVCIILRVIATGIGIRIEVGIRILELNFSVSEPVSVTPKLALTLFLFCKMRKIIALIIAVRSQ